MNNFSNNNETLESILESEYSKLNIDPEKKGLLNEYLNLLKVHDLSTYEHSIRVGLLASKIAGHLKIDQKAFLYSGLLHDIGKSQISSDILKKTDELNADDWDAIRTHPIYTHELLKGVFDFSAEIGGRHHKFQDSGYPKELPESSIPFSNKTMLMRDYVSRIISLVDFYDAITYRVNSKFGEKRKWEDAEVKSVLTMKNLDQRDLIEDLYVNGIFGKK